MPVMDGIEATRKIREFYADRGVSLAGQPIIIGITGHVEESFKTQGLQAGMNEVCGKPMTFKDIFKVL